jgi:hypothetical protein
MIFRYKAQLGKKGQGRAKASAPKAKPAREAARATQVPPAPAPAATQPGARDKSGIQVEDMQFVKSLAWSQSRGLSLQENRHPSILCSEPPSPTSPESNAMRNAPLPALLIFTILALPTPAFAIATVLTPRLHHLRVSQEREWSDFPAVAEASGLALSFQASPNAVACALRLRQQDVKQTWKVLLNGKELGRLQPDENDAVVYLTVPAGALVEGKNTLAVEQVGRVPDDVRIGEIVLDEQPVAQVLSETSVAVAVREVGSSGEPRLVPCRITVVNDQGALMSCAVSGERLAVRPGVVYTADGKARLGITPFTPGGASPTASTRCVCPCAAGTTSRRS